MLKDAGWDQEQGEKTSFITRRKAWVLPSPTLRALKEDSRRRRGEAGCPFHLAEEQLTKKRRKGAAPS